MSVVTIVLVVMQKKSTKIIKSIGGKTPKSKGLHVLWIHRVNELVQVFGILLKVCLKVDCQHGGLAQNP